MLAAMYRYDNQYKQMVSLQKMEKDFFDLSRTGSKVMDRLLKKSLKNWFDIVDRKSLLETVETLYANSYVNHQVQAILCDIYVQNKDTFLTLDMGDLQGIYDYEAKIDSLLKKFHLVNQPCDRKELVEAIKDEISCLFSEESGPRNWYGTFFQSYEPWLCYITEVGTAGFDFSRIIDIIGCGYSAGYIDDETAAAMLQRFGSAAEEIFGSWETFLFSAMLGKLAMMHDGTCKGFTILGSEDYICNIYGLVKAPSKPLQTAGLWQESNWALIEAALEQYVGTAEASEMPQEEKEFGRKNKIESECYWNLIGNSIVEKGLEGYIDQSQYTCAWFVPQHDSFERQVLFAKDVKSVEVYFSEEEIPFFDTLDHVVFTTKAIYIRERKFFFKKVWTRYSWDEITEISIDHAKLGMIEMKFNGKRIFMMNLKYERIGHTEKSYYDLDKKEREFAAKAELQTIKSIFVELVEACKKINQ